MLQIVVAPIVAQVSQAPVSERAMLGERIDGIVRSAHVATGGDLGIVIWDMETDVLFERHSDEAFPLAGLMRLAVALTAYRAVDAGTLALDTPIAQSSGSITVRDALARSLSLDDRSATDALYHAVGGADAIDTALRTAGFDGMLIRTDEAGLGLDESAKRTFARGGDNAGSPAAVALLLAELARGGILSDASRRAFIGALLHASGGGANRLAAGLPAGTRLAHISGTSPRFGNVRDACNDAGIAQINGRNVVIVAMLANARGTRKQCDAILAQVAQTAWAASAGVIP